MVALTPFPLASPEKSAAGAEAHPGKLNGSAAPVPPSISENPPPPGRTPEEYQDFLAMMREHLNRVEELNKKKEAENSILAPTPVSIKRMKAAVLGRPCVVDSMYYWDVGHIAAPGGVGKTTLLLWQAIQIVLGRDIFGQEVRMPGPVVFISAEDDRDSIEARLWQMCLAMDLCQDDLEMLEHSLHILDVVGAGVRLTTVEKDVVVPSDTLDRLIPHLKRCRPVMVFIDPAVSFGVGEARVNDAEQGLIEAGRRIVKECKCGVLYVHHTGKENARSDEIDQYMGRGGSAFADGSRMIFVMKALDPERWTGSTGNELQEGESSYILARPKMTWARSNQPYMYLKRKEFTFEIHREISGPEGAKVVLDNNAEIIDKFLRDEWPKGGRHNLETLKQLKIVKPREAIRPAIEYLMNKCRIREEQGDSTGGRKPKYLQPIDGS